MFVTDGVQMVDVRRQIVMVQQRHGKMESQDPPPQSQTPFVHLKCVCVYVCVCVCVFRYEVRIGGLTSDNRSQEDT